MKRIELTRKKLIIIVSAAAVVTTLGVYIIFYLPLISRLRTNYLDCRSAENEVFECRNIIESAGKVYGERVLMTEENISHAINELTRHGKLKGVNFISISPKEVREAKGSHYKILPIEMEIAATYNQLGTFLGSLDELEKGIVKVESFKIAPDEENLSRLMTDLIADIYLSGREDAE